MDDGVSMSSHINNLRSLIRQLAEVKAAIEDEDAKAILLNSLSSKYSNVVFTLSEIQSQSLDDMIAALLAEEKQTAEDADHSQQESAFYSRTRKYHRRSDKSEIECHYCRKRGHTAWDCRVRANDVLKGKVISNTTNIAMVEDPPDAEEIMDFGYPQNLSPEILKLYITQEGVRSPFSSKPLDKPVPNATLQVTGAVGWRREGLAYKKNEVFLDIVESVNLLMSSKGSVLRCDVTGKILMKCFLSGMPDLKLGLNDKIGLEKESQIKARPTRSGKTIELDDVTFHQCVNLTRFNSEKTVSFVPPDGEFELMKYRITEGVSLPFRVLPTIKELGRTRLEVNVKVKSAFGVKMFAMGVVVKVPVPKQTAKANFQVTTGRAKYNASIDSLVWKIRKFPGQTEATMSAEVELISTMVEKKAWTRPPIQMEFQVPMFTASGLRVRFLK
ncbi:hypothetical protein KI387_029381, partial [Taxus chinensis]